MRTLFCFSSKVAVGWELRYFPECSVGRMLSPALSAGELQPARLPSQLMESQFFKLNPSRAGVALLSQSGHLAGLSDYQPSRCGSNHFAVWGLSTPPLAYRTGALRVTKAPLPAGLILWLRPDLLVQHAQILCDPAGKDLGARARALCPLYAITGTALAAALGYSRRYRRMFFIQQCLFRHLRRLLTLLTQDPLEVWLRGVMPRLGAYWKVLTRPLQEVFSHPLSALPVLDVGMSRRQLEVAGGAKLGLGRALAGLTSLEELGAQDLATFLGEFERQHLKGIMLAYQRGLGWYRFMLSWGSVVIAPDKLHGFVRAKRARSVKRRRSKRLVKQTRYRFWPC